MAFTDKLFGDKGGDDPWKTRMVKDIHNPFRRYMGSDLQSTSDAIGGQNMFSDPWSYGFKDRKISDSGDVWEALGRVSKTGDTKASQTIDKNARKYVGPAAMSIIGGPYAGSAAAGVGQKLEGEDDKQAGKAAGIALLAGALGKYLGGAFGGGGEAASGAGSAGGEAAGSAGGGAVEAGTGLVATGGGEAAGSGAGSAVGGAVEPGTGLVETGGEAAAEEGGSSGFTKFMEEHPEVNKLLGQMGTNLSRGRPMTEGVAEQQAMSGTASRQAQAQAGQRNKLIEGMVRALEASGLSTDLTDDDQDGATNFTMRSMPDGTWNMQLKGRNVEKRPEGSIFQADDGSLFEKRGGEWKKINE